MGMLSSVLSFLNIAFLVMQKAKEIPGDDTGHSNGEIWVGGRKVSTLTVKG